ncbi:MAG: PhaM family polyhydroxyalkanoate granule multifunctional regulatory protein [Caldimonas sp.]
MSDASGFTKLVPGFDFLQSLVKNAGTALPGIGQWVAPTLDPAELEKRINELRTVQFWLEQNARMLATTIQALEVQKMTLSTLKTMNLQMGDLRESLKLKLPTPAPAPSPSAASARAPVASAPAATPARAPKEAAAPGVIDPMQWWGALTNQFTQLATTAMKDTATDAAKTLAGNILKQSFDSASATFKAAAGAPAKVASAAGAAAVGAAGAAGKALTRRPAAKKRATTRR